MPLSAEEILNLYRARKAHYAPLHGKMKEIADIYNGKARVPLPDMERDEQPAIPNLLQRVSIRWLAASPA